MTRANIYIQDHDKVILKMYVHSDGYPTGVGLDIASKYKDYKLVDGIKLGEMNICNGMGDFAVQLITFLKNNSIQNSIETSEALAKILPNSLNYNHEVGGLYIEPINDDNECVDYVYWLYNQKDKIAIKCFEYKTMIYEGSLEDFISWARTREESEE
jgi:hypothetical protein